MADLTPEQAIQQLRGLSPDQQRAVLVRLPAPRQQEILQTLRSGGGGTKPVPSDLPPGKSIANAPDKSLWPSGATISAYNPSPTQKVVDFLDKLRLKATPGPEAHTDIMASPVTGLLRALKGNVEVFGQGKLKQGFKDEYGGTMETLQLPSLFVAPEASETAGAISNAGKLFDPIEQAIGHTPVDTSVARRIAIKMLRDNKLAGDPLPEVVRGYLRRVVSGGRSLSFNEARKIFSSSGGRLAKMDTSSVVTPGVIANVERQLGMFKAAMDSALRQAATRAGMGAEYANAIRMYEIASRFGRAGKVLKRSVPPVLKAAGLGAAATAGGAAGYELVKPMIK